MHHENTRLRAELARRGNQRTRLAELEVENRHLSDLLELKQALAIRSSAAHVIGADATGLSRTLMVERGSNEGLRPGWR